MNTARNKLIEYRKKQGLTQEELAKRVNISRAYLCNLENGKYTPSLEVAYNIAHHLNTSIDELFF
ncbi:helix-turn-helix transcriptional regulator [Ornithinibacillus xuwenensis]|uniref:Helix-turn-helix transcriptional regulator n=1 Tax=Ornithinibacillus xuwenensis TaxID=3144668 RepID=A0ABU9XBU6_9BACI